MEQNFGKPVGGGSTDSTTPPTTDPTNPDVAGWAFLTWVKLNNKTNFARNTSINANADILKPDVQNPENENRFDFAKPVTQDVTIIPCWTATKPQIYTFTVENEVIGGWPNDEFDYTIEVKDVQVYGKRTSTSPNVGAPNKTWGKDETNLANNTSYGSNSVTTKLKRGEEYKVRITVSRISAYNEDNYSVVIDVIDRDNVVIKSDQLLYCINNGNKYFSTDLIYTFRIYQDEKPGFTTTITETEDPNNYIAGDTTGHDSTDQNYYYQFTSKMGTKTNRINSPVINPYAEGETCDVVVHFRNEGPNYAAPTGLTSRHTPFILIMVFGILILTFGGIGIIRKKKRLPDSGPAKAKVQSHKQWVEYRTPLVRGAPPPAPRCPRAELWRGPSGKRGDAR